MIAAVSKLIDSDGHCQRKNKEKKFFAAESGEWKKSNKHSRGRVDIDGGEREGKEEKVKKAKQIHDLLISAASGWRCTIAKLNVQSWRVEWGEREMDG